MAEIKDAAWADIQDTGTPDCSLRAIARRMGMAPSALYRYFPSRDALLTALIVDAFDDLAAVLGAAYAGARESVPTDDASGVFAAVAASCRRWALDQPLRYRLIFGTPVGGYEGNAATTSASMRSSAVLLDVMVDLVAAGLVDLERVNGDLSTDARVGFEQWDALLPMSLPPAALAVALDCYVAMHGAIQLEVNGHLPYPLRDREAVFLDSMRRVLGAALR